MGFGRYIRREREKRDILLTDFAKKLKISPAYWSRIERELEKPPKDNLIQKAAQILDLDPDEAFIQARRFPPDIQRDVGRAVRAYRRLPKTRE
jgi:HTH-type transcriptional regulator, competence development regulator